LLNKRSYILLFCGLAGILCYFFLRPSIEFYHHGPINNTKGEIEQYISEVAPKMGFSTDSLAMLSMRKQHLAYYKKLKDTAGSEITPTILNENGVHTQSWETIIAPVGQNEMVFGTQDQLFDETGRLKVHISNSGKVIRISSHGQNPNPTFLQGDSLFTLVENFINDALSYDLSLYEPTRDFGEDSIVAISEGLNQERELMQGNDAELLEFNWQLKGEKTSGVPENISLSLSPVVREYDTGIDFRTEFGFSISSFSAYDELEPKDLDAANITDTSEDQLFTYLFFFIVFVLAALVFSVGTRNIFKGKAEWRRALLVFVVISAGVYLWRAIFFVYTFNPFLSNMGIFSSTVNHLLLALVIGFYGAFAYVSWEALARSQKQNQVDIIDALWQRKIFVSETGLAIIHGLAMGGIAIGIISSMVYLMDEILIQIDSQFGFAEPSIPLKLVTINISSWTTAWLVCIAQIGFVYSILKHWIKKEWLANIIAIFFTGVAIAILGRLVGTSGSAMQDILIYIGIAVIFIYALKEFGLLTVCSGWWFFTVFFMIQPYFNSPSIEVAYVSWAQAILMACVFVYGFVAYKYGIPVSELENYIPEYEERIAQHLRVEKEIEIARESQYKLMPLQPPKADGFDVYGFFMPSFEVGGDYFDYVLTENEDGEPTALTMVIVDVSGKAMRAAMPAVFTSGLLLSRIKHDYPDEVLSDISEPIFQRTDKRTFITCVLARLDMKAQKLAIANAGHCRPILKRNGIAEYIHTPKPSFPLGIREGVKYNQEVISVKKGDFFLFYSDGLPEAANEKGERYGFDQVPRLIESIDTDRLSAQEISQEIKRTVQKFSNYQLADDTTIICLKV